MNRQTSGQPVRVLFALPGLHRVNRGAETAFESVARALARRPGYAVTLIGSGRPRQSEPYRFRHVPCVPRELFEHFPRGPYVRSPYAWEELTFAMPLIGAYNPLDYDVTFTCGYPYTNWVLARRTRHGRRPFHIFVTQNGDWMCQSDDWEYRHFRCDGLICTNPEYYHRNRGRYLATLIPNGVDPDLFRPGASHRRQFGLPRGGIVALIASALIPSKRVIEGIRCAAKVPELHLVVAGDGSLRREVDALGHDLLGRRFTRLSLPRRLMPRLYRSVDVFLHMSQDEPSANVYMEALATGVPIVTHDRAVTRWTLEDQATLINTSSERDVVAAIERAIIDDTPEARQRRRQLAIRRFAWSSIAERYGEFMDDVMARTIR